MATHAAVRRLYLKMLEVLGEDAAETLMELLHTGYDHHRDPLMPGVAPQTPSGPVSP